MAYLATTNFPEDKNFVDKWLYTMRTGEMDLSWMNAKTEKITPQSAECAPRADLSRPRCRAATASPICRRKCADNRSYAPRGAEIPDGRARRAAVGLAQERAVGIQHRKLLRGSGLAAMERDHRYPMGPPRRRRDARGDRQGAFAADDVPHRSRDDRDRYARDVAAAAQSRFHRGARRLSRRRRWTRRVMPRFSASAR